MKKTSATTSHMFQSLDEDANSILLRVFVTPKKIILSERVLRGTSTPGIMKEVLLHKTQFELLTNSQGEKYLKHTRTPANDGPEDVSLRALYRSELVWSNHYIGMEIPSQVIDLIHQNIAEWFDYPCDTDLPPIKAELFFPALKTMGHLMNENHTITQVLSELNNTFGVKSGRLLTALRENSDWISFTKDICDEGMVSSMSDQNAIWENPDLLHMAVMRLDMGIHEVSEYEGLSYSFLSTFDTIVDRRCIKFMLDYIPESRLAEATNLLFDLATRCTALKQFELNSFSFMFLPGKGVWSIANIPVQKVPTAQRPEIAQLLLSRLYEVESMIAEAENARLQRHTSPDRRVESGLYQVFARWVGEHIVAPKLATELTWDDIESRFTELYGEPLSIRSEGLSIHETKTGTFIAHTPVQGVVDTIQMLNSIVKHPLVSQGMGMNERNYYSDKDGKICALDKNFHSFDDVMNLVESSAKRIDEALARLDRKATPENRAAYLTFQHRERRLKNAWHYYDLGVTEPSKIIALKTCKVTDEDDIRTYAALPDELFYELIGLLNTRVAERSKYLGSAVPYNTEAKRYLEAVRLI